MRTLHAIALLIAVDDLCIAKLRGGISMSHVNPPRQCVPADKPPKNHRFRARERR